MLGGRLAREDSVADQALTQVLSEGAKHFADSIGPNDRSDGIVRYQVTLRSGCAAATTTVRNVR